MQNFKKLLTFFQVLVLVLALCFIPASAADGGIVLDNAKAAVTSATYDAVTGFVTGLSMGSTKVTYTVGDNLSGSFDVYLEVSKQTMGYGTTPFSIKINDGKEIIPIIEYAWCKSDKSDINDKGVFLCMTNAALKAGDTITVAALSGFGFGTTSYQPYIGDILLYQAGTKVAVGYDGVIPVEQAKDASDPLSGLQLAWLGSSVAYGQMAQGWSTADYLEDTHKALKSYKYCVPGTTLVDETSTSYISRMKQIPKDLQLDYFMVQLSTNDAAANKPFGALAGSKNMSDFDTKTIYGGLEYIIAYVEQTWKCPVVFFTGSYYDKSTYNNDGTAYGKTVEALLDVQKKWGINVIDLYNDKELTAMYNTDEWKTYMSDGVHPKAAGYKDLWGPRFEKALTAYGKGSDVITDPVPTPSIDTAKHTVVLSSQKIKVNGVEKAFEVYNIDGSNYFKVRDVAFVLNGTGSQFSIIYDEANKAIKCTTGQAYTAVGGELVTGVDKSSTAVPSTQSLTIDGKAANLTAFNIGGSNFIKLVDMAGALNFTATYDDTTRTVLIKSA